MYRIAVTGSTGYLASLIQLYNKEKFLFIPISRKDLDLENTDEVKQFFEKLEFDTVLHAAARTQTTDCEMHPDETKKVNTDSAIQIAEICQKKKARFIFLSTEQVFNDKKETGPYTEETSPKSTSVYGNQKLAVEEYLNTHELDFITLRLSWMMGLSFPELTSSPNIIKNVMNAMFYQKPTKFTVNEMRGMTYAKNFAQQFDKILGLPKGTYHFSSNNNLSTYEFANFIAKELGFDNERIRQFILADKERYADQFRDLRLATDKIQQYGIKLQSSQEDAKECLKDFGW